LKAFWKYINRWWLVIAVSLILQGVAIRSAYEQRGYLAYGGEYLIVPIVLLVSIEVERAINEFLEAKDDRRNLEDRQ
jgi:uncharacterized membrane protein YbhN (UPF0104 family)